ncbi:MAG: hypothetical protein ACFFDI_27800, partial [Promethearchaeota archaeon]
MKPTEHQETHTTIEETPSNNEDTNKKDNKVCCPKAGYNQHTSLILPHKLIDAGFQYATTIEGIEL